MRLFTGLLTFLLALSACSPASPQLEPTIVSAKPAFPSPDVSRPVSEEGAPAQYETSALVTLWDSKIHGYRLLPVEPSNGIPVPGIAPITLGINYYYAFSSDHKTLAILGYKSDNPSDPTLHVIDLSTWQDVATPLDVTGWAIAIAFSPDGKFLGIGCNYRESALLIFDIEKKQIIARITPDFDVTRLKFTSNGSFLMAYGHVIINRFTENEQTSGPAKAVLFDAQDLSERWVVDLEGVRDGIYPIDEKATGTTNLHEDPGSAMYFYPGLVFAPDRDSLYAVHADEDKLTTVDFGTHSVSTVSIRPKLSWFERFLMLTADVAYAKIANGTSRNAVISPDGSTIYTIGNRNEATQSSKGDWEFTQVSLGLQAIDTSDGSELFRLDTSTTELRIVPDGSSLLLQSWDGLPSTDVLDAKQGDLTNHFKLAILVPARRLDGTLLLASAVTDEKNRTRMTAYSTAGELLGEWWVPDYGGWLIAP